jgi:hypothetical protein
MKRLTIKLRDNDQSMIIPLKGINNLSGYDDDVLATSSLETAESINIGDDAETRRLLPSTTYPIQFQFWRTSSSSFVNLVAPDEFTGSTDFNTAGAKNSFFVIQLYDTFRDESNSKKHTGYYNGFDFAKTNLVSSYSFSAENEFSNLYVSQKVLDGLSGLTKDFYVKFLFYCAKSGKFYSFFNQNTPAVTTQEKIFHKITIDPNMLSYSFNPNYSPILLRELRNPAFDTFINNTVQSISVEKPIYPSGNTFDNSGTYITI